jgi:Mg-chelatase subunit ChlD
MTEPAPLLAVFNPTLAAAAAVAAVAVPLVIHLLFRKRYQIVPWGAVRFLLVAERRHRRRIDQWLLLALRALALLLPLFAMVAATKWAEELWQSIKPGRMETVNNTPRTHHVLVIDASLSMTARAGEKPTRFEHALALAENLVRTGNPGDGFTLLFLAGTQPQAVVPGPANDPEKVVAELRKLKPTHAAADIAPALAAVAEVLARSPRAYPRRQVTFFSDLQRASWANTLGRPDAAPPEVWQRILGRADVAVVDTARRDADNLAIVDLSLADPLPLADAPAAVTATVHNHSRTERRHVQIELTVGRPSATGGAITWDLPTKKDVELIPAGGRGSVTFALEGPARFRDRGIHVVQARLIEGDDLPADDTRALAVEVRDGLKVTLVDGKFDPDPERRAAWYASEALFPTGIPATKTPARPKTISVPELADPVLGDLTAPDCVFLCDVRELTPETVAKLEAVLKRGGGVVIGLGPNAAANRELYNRLLFADGHGILPGPLGDVISVPPDDSGFRLSPEEAAFAPGQPLAAFRGADDRAALASVAFRGYVRMDAPPDGRARRVLSFVPATTPGADAPAAPPRKPDPAVVEWQRHRGRVVVYTSTFNQDWTLWPLAPTYLPFVQEALRFAATNPDRHTVRVGDALEEFFPAAAVGQTAELTGPDGLAVSLPITAQDESGYVRFADTHVSGLYRLGIGKAGDRVFAVNVPEASPSGGAESDLRRIDPSEFKPIGPVQVVVDPTEVRPSGDPANGFIVSAPKPHGPMIARFAIMLALVVLAAEVLLAWRFGPARGPGGGSVRGSVRPVERRWSLRLLSTAIALVPLAVAALALVAVFHAERTGNLLGFLPTEWRHTAEQAVGVPAAAPGEGTKWRLEGFTAFVRNWLTDRRIIFTLAGLAVVLTVAVYRLERRAVGGIRRVVLPAALRIAIFLLVFFVLLAQMQLAFDREGWPEVVILVDTSASMSTTDDIKDPAVRAKAAELLRGANLSAAHRLKLAQLLLTRTDADWLDRLLTEKQVKVYVYAVDSQVPRLVADMSEPADAEAGRKALLDLKPEGESSQLGDGVQWVLKRFRGGSLAAVVMFTDGITTAGDDLPRAAREASRSGVPLYLVGVGDARETPDLGLADLQVEDVITRGDRLFFQARLTSRGAVAARPVPIILYEKQGEKLIERGRTAATPDPAGNPVPIRITHTPAEAGEKIFVLDVPAQPEETDTSNNRIERTVLVSEARRIRVLYVEGSPRYDFRFAKTLMERESDRIAGNKTVEIRTVLLDASRGWAETDRSALPDFPTRDQLFEYDAVVLGDFEPKQLPRSNRAMQDLADFVRVRGGGLMFLAGELASPAAFADTPLADVMPVVPTDGAALRRTSEEQPITEGYRPKLTPTGQLHPLFRFAPDEAESARIWSRLQPLLWYAKGYRRKLTAEVLATHPDRPSEGPEREKHPLALQQFVGAGRVLFLGFDETWRWRFRADEEHFNRFWLQAVRVLSRSRLGRVELKLDKQTPYRRSERIVVTVRFPDDAPAPASDVPVRVKVQRGPLPNSDGTSGTGMSETISLSLAKVEGTRATYQAALTRTPDGEYRFVLDEPEVTGSRPRAEAKVLPPPAEMDRLEMNRADLAAAAALSNGGFYTLASAEDVFRDLKNLQRVPLNQPCEPLPLWNHPATFALVLLLLAAEWLLRKRERLL